MTATVHKLPAPDKRAAIMMQTILEASDVVLDQITDPHRHAALRAKRDALAAQIAAYRARAERVAS